MAVKKLAVVLNSSWNIYNFRLNLLKSLKKDAYEIYLIAPFDEYSELLKKEGFFYFDIYMDSNGTNPFKDLLFSFALYKILRKISPDILLTYTIKPNIYGNFVAKLLNISVISNISGLGTVFIKKSLATYLVKILYKYSLRFAKKVLFQNSDDKNLFLKEKLLSKNLSSLIPGSGVDTNRFSPIEKKDRGDFTFLFLARMLKDKGIVEYIKASEIILKTHKNVKFYCLGELDENNPISVSKTFINDCEEKGFIKYLGKSKDVKKEIALSDCVVLPSYREGLPKALLEAGSMAKPLITSDAPGCKELVEDGFNGYLSKAKDSKALALAMDKMLRLKKEELLNMGINSRKLVKEKFSDEIVIAKYKKFIREFST